MMSNSRFIGLYRIIEIQDFDYAYMSMQIDPYIKLDEENGAFQFGLVEGFLSFQKVQDNQIEFFWEGTDELDAVFGSGSITLDSDVEISGEIRFNNRENHEFKAVKGK